METLEKQKTGAADAGKLSVQEVTDPHLGEQIRITHITVSNETWVVDLDKATGLPLTIHATDASGGLLEHYEFRNFQLNQADLLTADAFDPNARWGSKTNLLSKIARGKEETTVK
jgi:negative regulator of sigma E activity